MYSLAIFSFLEVAKEDIRDFVGGLLDFILLEVVVFGARLLRIELLALVLSWLRGADCPLEWTALLVG